MKNNAITRRKAARLKRHALTSTILVCLTMPTAAMAQQQWKGTTSGVWFDGSNWSNGQVPTAADDVTIDVSKGSPGVVDVGNNAVANKIVIADTSGSGVNFRIEKGATLTSTSGVVGNLAGASGSVTVGTFPSSGFISKWANSGTLVIGNAGYAFLDIGDGEVENTDGTIGALVGSDGTVSLNGPTAVWTNTGDLFVADKGKGVLNVFNGANVRNNQGAIGFNAGSTGAVTVSGADSKWTNVAALTIGDEGSGTLAIQNGGMVINADGTVGRNAGGSGAVTVTGKDSTWLNNGLVIGDAGAGTLNILKGGWAGANIITVAKSVGSTGGVVVDGAASKLPTKLFSASSLSIGEKGNGTLTVTNGGWVENAGGYLGYYADAYGQATISGVGSTWTNSEEIYVGALGTGLLDIKNGGAVSGGGNIHVGSEAGSSGTVNIDGTNSSLTATGMMVIGDKGTGKLSVSHGGSVTSGDGIFGMSGTGTGAVDGIGSKWDILGDLYVGAVGTGTLDVAHGGQLASKIGYIGYSEGGSNANAVTVSGTGSTWTATSLGIGLDGAGTLNILGGGVVTNGGGAGDVALIGAGTTAAGVANVSGAGSTWNAAGAFVVGYGGSGTLDINNGGSVHVTDAGNTNPGSSMIGSVAGSVGIATVAGAGSSWTSAGNLMVGRRGKGTLNVNNGGVVGSLTGTIGSEAGSDGGVSVQGAGSVWNVTNDLTVGDAGSMAMLQIGDGGKVSVGGTVTLAKSSGIAFLNITGTGGTLDATNVQFGTGTGTINFDHTSTNYNFDAAISGLGTIQHYSGVTYLRADSGGFTGKTHVNGGKLIVDGKLGSGAMDVQSGGTLGGKGVIGGDVTIAAGGALSGIQGQTLTMQNLDLASGANVNVTLNAPGGAVLFDVVNDLTLDGTLNIAAGNAFGPGVYRLMSYGGALTDNGLDIGTTPAGSVAGNFAVQTAVAGKVNLVSNVAPNLAFWDGDGAGNANNNSVDGGSGVWTAASTNWTDANGTTNGVMHPQPTFAIFQGGGGAVTVDAGAGAIAVTGMQFASDDYKIGGAAITLADPDTIIRVGDGTLAGANYSATIDSVLTGAGGLDKTDYGTLVLTADNSYGGGTTITNGVLQLGNGGTGGSIVGDVAINSGGLVFNRSDMTTFAGAISGVGALDHDGAGITWLTGNSGSYNGYVSANNGTLGVKAGGVLNSGGLYAGWYPGTQGAFAVDGAGSTLSSSGYLVLGGGGKGVLSVANGGTVNIGQNGVLGSFAGSTGTATVTGAGSSWSNAGDLYVGYGGIGTLAIANGGTVSNKIGLIGQDTGASGSVLVDGAGSKWINSGSLVIGNSGTGTLTLSDGGIASTGGVALLADQAGSTGTLNIGGAAGSAAKAAGTLNAGTLEFGQGSGTLNFNHTDSGYTFAASMLGTGTINHLAGTSNLTGNSNGYFGAINVGGGKLAVNGQLGNGQFTIGSGATLGGNGLIGSLVAQSGAVIAPGNSIGTLNVAGNGSFAAGSTYQVELDSTGQADRINFGGAASIANGALLNVVKLDGAPYVAGTRYTVLEADGGVAGSFKLGGNIASPSAFLGLIDHYDATHVYLDVTKMKSFGAAGITPNQKATGNGADALGAGNPVYDAVVMLPTDAQAQHALDQLSGEMHASLRGMMIEDSRYVREAAWNRMQTATGDGFALWGRGYGGWGRLDSDGNAAAIKRDASGVFMGSDGLLGNWRVGALGGVGRSSFNVRDRASRGRSDNYHFGLYGSTQWGALDFRTGAAYTWQRIASDRSVVFPGFSQRLTSRYNAGTTQAFGELGYGMVSGTEKLEPFANLAWVKLDAGAFREKGGTAALASDAATTETAFTTLGLRFASSGASRSGKFTTTGMVGWSHAFGDIAPPSLLSRFAEGGDAFTIHGAPVARNAVVIDVGLDYAITPAATFGVSYGGRFGPGASDQTARVNFSFKF